MKKSQWWAEGNNENTNWISGAIQKIINKNCKIVYISINKMKNCNILFAPISKSYACSFFREFKYELTNDNWKIVKSHESSWEYVIIIGPGENLNQVGSLSEMSRIS